MKKKNDMGYYTNNNAKRFAEKLIRMIREEFNSDARRNWTDKAVAEGLGFDHIHDMITSLPGCDEHLRATLRVLDLTRTQRECQQLRERHTPLYKLFVRLALESLSIAAHRRER